MIMINTLGDLWEKHFSVYPMGIEYYIEDENIEDCTSDMDEMQEFFDKYRDYEVLDFCIKCYSKESVALILVLKKGEPEDD